MGLGNVPFFRSLPAMGLRINTTNLRAFARLERAKRVQAKAVSETNTLRLSDPVNLKSANSQHGSEVKRALKTSQSGRDEEALRPLRSGLDAISREFFSRLSDSERVRSERLEGYGDRAPFRSNIPADAETVNRFNSENETREPEDTDLGFEATPTQEKLVQLRESLRQFVEDEVVLNSENSVFSIKESIDDTFGSGVSELFQVRLGDAGAGRSAIEIDQVSLEEVDSDEKREILNRAILINEMNFQSPRVETAVEGADVKAVIDELDEILGARGKSLVRDLRSALGVGQAFESAKEELRSELQNLGLSRSEITRASERLDDLDRLRDRARDRFSSSPLLDDLKVEFQSERRALAFSPSEISESLERSTTQEQDEEEYFQTLAASRLES